MIHKTLGHVIGYNSIIIIVSGKRDASFNTVPFYFRIFYNIFAQ